jgi:hypothetical protein
MMGMTIVVVKCDEQGKQAHSIEVKSQTGEAKSKWDWGGKVKVGLGRQSQTGHGKRSHTIEVKSQTGKVKSDWAGEARKKFRIFQMDN